MSLVRHPDFHGSVVVRREPDGRLVVQGKAQARFGYAVRDGGGDEQGVWVRWHADADGLTVENDRFGFLPLYYAADDRVIRVATSIRELLALGVDARLDDTALAVFLRLGHYLGDDTPFGAIRTLGPGMRLRFTRDGLRLEPRVAALPVTRTVIDRDEAVRRYGDLMQAAVERHMPDPAERMCVPLSAGRDSRHILYALVRAGRAPHSVVTARAMAPRPDTDATIAARIAAGLGLPHAVLEQSADRFGDEIEKNLLTGFFADEHVQMMPVVRWLRDERIAVSWDGIAGDIFSCGVYDDASFVGGFREPGFRALLAQELGDEGYLRLLLRPQALRRWPREAAEARLAQELARYADLPNPVAPYFFFNRVRRKLALSPFGMLNQRTHVLAPYLDHALFDTLVGLPAEFFRGRQFHSEAIERFYPELPRHPFVSVHEGFVPERRERIWRFGWQIARLARDAHRPDAPASIARGALLPRLAKAALSREYGTRMPIMFSRLIVLMQLESRLRHGASA